MKFRGHRVLTVGLSMRSSASSATSSATWTIASGGGIDSRFVNATVTSPRRASFDPGRSLGFDRLAKIRERVFIHLLRWKVR